MIRKTFISLILFSIALFIGGCANTEYKIEISSDGAITEYLEIVIDDQAILSSGFDLTDSIDIIVVEINTFVNHLKNSFYSADNGLSASEKSGITSQVGGPEVNGNTISLTFTFNDISEYRYFYGIEKDMLHLHEVEIEDYYFYEKIIRSSNTKYMDMNTTTLSDNIYNYFSDLENGTSVFGYGDLKTYFLYSTHQSGLKSNSDEVYSYNGFNVHKWSIPYDNFNKTIEFYEYRMVTFYWYAIAAFSTLIFLVFIILCDTISKIFKKLFGQTGLTDKDGESYE